METYFPSTDTGQANKVRRRTEARRDLAYAALHLGRYAEAELACREAIKERPGILKLHTLLALALCRQGRSAEAREAFEAAFKKFAPTPTALARDIQVRVDFLRALYVQALVQPDDGAGTARRRASLDRATELLAAESDEVRQLSYFREIQTWLDEARAKPVR